MRARDVSLNGREVSGRTVEDDEWICPCSGALPMGSSWSLYFAQSVKEHALPEVAGFLVSSTSQVQASLRICLRRQPWSPLSGSPPYARGTQGTSKRSSMRWVCGPMRRAWRRTYRLHSETYSIAANMSPRPLLHDGGDFTECWVLC